MHLEVALYKIGVAGLAGAVVVQVIVLDVPSLGKHPVEPVAHPRLQAAHGKAAAREAAGAVVLPVVAAVADVVADHRPSAQRPRAQRDYAHRVGPHPAGEHTHRAAEVGPADDLLEVRDVLGALALL